MRLRVESGAWRRFAGALRAEQHVETAGIILAERVSEGVLVARSLREVPADGYLIRERDRLRIDPIALNRLVRPARDRGWSVLTAHTHPGADSAWFSLADDMGDQRLMPSLHHQFDGPHGSLVLAGRSDHVLGRLFDDAGTVEPLELVRVGPMLNWPGGGLRSPRSGAAFHRQELALGAHGQGLLRQLRVGVVGLGGTGSACLVQLAHLGVGAIVLVDGDMVELSNISRILGAVLSDVGEPKVTVAARYVEALGLETEVELHPQHLGRGAGAGALASCDVVLSCVDRHTPRALLNRLAYDALIPVIDMGSAFRVGQNGEVTSAAGRVVVVGPGRSCLACWGHIDPDRLREESLSSDEYAAQVRRGYVEGAQVHQPSVVAFNTAVAGAAVIELLRVVTRFAGTEHPPNRLAFDFAGGVVRRNELAGTGECRVCSDKLVDRPVRAQDRDPPGLGS